MRVIISMINAKERLWIDANKLGEVSDTVDWTANHQLTVDDDRVKGRLVLPRRGSKLESSEANIVEISIVSKEKIRLVLTSGHDVYRVHKH